MIALLVLGVALPLFALVACGIVATEGAGRPALRLGAGTADRVGWLTLAQTCALLAGLVLRLVVQG